MANDVTLEPTMTVAVVGGEAAIGRAIGQLLSGLGYGVRLLPEPLSETVGEALAGAGLLILAPTLSAECREALAKALAKEKLPVMELPWPCRTEELERAIEGVLRRPVLPRIFLDRPMRVHDQAKALRR